MQNESHKGGVPRLKYRPPKNICDSEINDKLLDHYFQQLQSSSQGEIFYQNTPHHHWHPHKIFNVSICIICDRKNNTQDTGTINNWRTESWYRDVMLCQCKVLICVVWDVRCVVTVIQMKLNCQLWGNLKLVSETLCSTLHIIHYHHNVEKGFIIQGKMERFWKEYFKFSQNR